MKKLNLKIYQNSTFRFFLMFVMFNTNHSIAQNEIVIDKGGGLYDTISNSEFMEINNDNIFIVNNLSCNNISFKKVNFIKGKSAVNEKDDFKYENGNLTILRNQFKLKRKIDNSLMLHSYYIFKNKGVNYQYFIFFSINYGGNINKFYTGLLVKERERFVELPNSISTTNPNVLFCSCSSELLSGEDLFFIEVRIELSDNIKVYALKDYKFELLERYRINLEPTDYLNFNYKINLDKSLWFKKIN